MNGSEELELVLKRLIVEALLLPIQPEQIDDRAPIFEATEKDIEPAERIGLGLDSLSALEILAAMSERWELPFEDIEPQNMRSIAALACYVRERVQVGATQ